MKTAEEWASDRMWYEKIPQAVQITRQDVEVIIKQIQLDAWKQGMTDAAALIYTMDADHYCNIKKVEAPALIRRKAEKRISI